MNWLHPLDDGRAVLVRVRAQPGATRTMVKGEHGQALKIAVAAPPVDGKANAALIKFLAQACGLPTKNVTLRRGTGSRDKAFRLEGIGPAQVAGALLNAGGPLPRQVVDPGRLR